MTPTTKRFAWHDRDTAARDLLQLATYAPHTVRSQALRLLEAFRSSAIFSELEQMVLDEKAAIWDRRYALRAIAVMADDLYLPQFAPFAIPGEIFTSKLSLEDFIGLVSRHPRNLD